MAIEQQDAARGRLAGGFVRAAQREVGFRQRESALLDACTQRDGVLLATGAGAVLDPRNRDRLAERGYVLWLDTTVEQQLERLARDTRRPLLAGEDRRSKLEGMAAQRTPLYREIADLALSGAHETASEAAARCIALLDGHWQRRQAA